MGLLRRKPSAGERAAEATREAAVTASENVQHAVGTAAEHVQGAIGTASVRVREAADATRERADAAAGKLSRKAEKARARAEAAGKRADKATRKAGKRAKTASKRARKAAGNATTQVGGTVDKASLKADHKIAKMQAKAESGARRAEAKAQNNATKAQLKSEQNQLKQAERERQAREWNAAKAKRYLAIGKLVAPLLAPYAVAAAGTLRHRWDDHRSRRLGVSTEELGSYSGRGGQLHSRISRIARSLDELESDGTTGRNADAKRFVEATRPRLHDFAAAVRAAEQMPAQRRKTAYRAVSHDLDRIEVELLSFLGIRA
ncbi:hypothetical protein EV383_0103 [Pseudonocardia sediminis]|uniref:Uncharacterized protein n=1 Tax=Pseudonocardia sediminis TaxID=1397368 RepID=A0A4Q7UTI4_PSEST|nr:DUF6474 family protein [Pseudonocardia sediminis]RZT83303.1 hypothetical protein EV383_0103 [Pseudonocardia sediminis]